MSDRALLLVGLALAAGCARAHAQDDAAPTTLVGRVYFGNVQPTGTVYGSVRLILYGTGEISDDCPDANLHQFIAEYHGGLAANPDGAFEAHLIPFEPPVATPSGCPATRIDVERLDRIAIVASFPGLGLRGFGMLDYQTLTSTDNDRLQRGSFDRLQATLTALPVPRR
jgi:hypothetical protein